MRESERKEEGGKTNFFRVEKLFAFFFGYVLVPLSFQFILFPISKSVATRIILRFIAKLWLARCQIFCPPFLKLQ